MLGELQQLTLDRHYGKNIDGEAVLRAGWAKVLTVRDLSKITDGSVPEAATALWVVWDDDHKALGSDVEAKNRIVAALEKVRSDTHEVLRNLD